MTLRVLVVMAVIAQSSWAQQDPIPFPRARLAKLLGLSLKETPVKVIAPVVSTLACQVLGTLESRATESSIASVQCGRVAKSVRIGDALEDGVVESIGFGVVTVRRGARVEELGRGVAIASAATMVAPAVASRAAVAEGRVSRAVVEDLMKNPGTILGQVQLLPAFSAGKFVGVRANFVQDGSLISALGLQRGDVIRGVNGKPLDSLPAAFAALQLIGSTGDINVELDRGGQTVLKTVRVE